MDNPRLFINGEWVGAGRAEPVINAYTGAAIASVPVGDESTLDAAVAAAHAAFPQTRRMPAHERGRILASAAAEIGRRAKEFAETIVAEAGKPITLAEGEVARCVQTFSAAADEARRSHGQTIEMDALPAGVNHFALVKRFPIGVVYGIAPFNFPLNLVAHKVAPAIAAGCTMVLKPAPRTPLSSLLLAEVLSGAGLPAGQVNVVTCPNELAQRPLADDRVRMVSFTGSPAVGWPLKSAAGKKKVTLELGGNAAVIVHDDADLDSTVPLIASGAFAFAGQSCISVQRIFVHRPVYDAFVQRLLAHTQNKVLTGDPARRDVLVGPMISRAALDRVARQVDSARAAGATVLCGGAIADDGKCYLPTILANVDPGHEVCATEVFAPIAVVAAYDAFDAALAAVNDSPFGLQAGVFTRDIGRIMAAFHELEVGGVMVNQVPTWRVEHMPYGGVKDSGFGREGLKYAIEEMTEPRLLTIRL